MTEGFLEWVYFRVEPGKRIRVGQLGGMRLVGRKEFRAMAEKGGKSRTRAVLGLVGNLSIGHIFALSTTFLFSVLRCGLM